MASALLAPGPSTINSVSFVLTVGAVGELETNDAGQVDAAPSSSSARVHGDRHSFAGAILGAAGEYTCTGRCVREPLATAGGVGGRAGGYRVELVFNGRAIWSTDVEGGSAHGGRWQYTLHLLPAACAFTAVVRAGQHGQPQTTTPLAVAARAELRTLGIGSIGSARPSWGCSLWEAELHVAPSDTNLSWTVNAPGDWLWTGSWSPTLVEQLYRAALFTLPDGDGAEGEALLMIPNPVNRYCIDLRRDAKWNKSQTMRASRLAKFRLSVNADFGASLTALMRGHDSRGGTWFTAELLAMFKRMLAAENDRGAAGDQATGTISHRVFELWDTTDEAAPELLAVTAGFGVGCCFHDYSMFTLVRDQRSAGSVLTKTVAHALKSCGYSLWYWGYKGDYMEAYDAYGGRDFPRFEFWQRWQEGIATPPTTDVRAFVSTGRALVPPRLDAAGRSGGRGAEKDAHEATR